MLTEASGRLASFSVEGLASRALPQSNWRVHCCCGRSASQLSGLNKLAIDREMFSGSMDAGFVSALPSHHGDFKPDCVGVSTRGGEGGWAAYARDKNTSARLGDKNTSANFAQKIYRGVA